MDDVPAVDRPYGVGDGADLEAGEHPFDLGPAAAFLYPAEIAALARQRPLAELRRDGGEIGAAAQLRDDAVRGGPRFPGGGRRIVVEGDFRNQEFGLSPHGLQALEFLVDLLFAHADGGAQAQVDVFPPRDLRTELVEHRIVSDAAFGEKGFEPAAGDAVAVLDLDDGFLNVAFGDSDPLAPRFLEPQRLVDEVAQHGAGDAPAHFVGAREVGVVNRHIDPHFEVEDRDRPVVDHGGDPHGVLRRGRRRKPQKDGNREKPSRQEAALLTARSAPACGSRTYARRAPVATGCSRRRLFPLRRRTSPGSRPAPRTAFRSGRAIS